MINLDDNKRAMNILVVLCNLTSAIGVWNYNLFVLPFTSYIDITPPPPARSLARTRAHTHAHTHTHTHTHTYTHTLNGTIFLRVPKYVRCDLLLITRILSNYSAPLMILICLITHKVVLPSTYRLNVDNAR